MKLTKKLVIMSGKGFEKGTVALEKNALSVHARANLHSLRNLSHDEYILLIICGEASFFVELGSQGTTSKQFSLPYEADISALHCAVLLGETVALYGTTENKRMWEGNIIDIARRTIFESKKNNSGKAENPKNTQEHLDRDKDSTAADEPKNNINNYFLDIITDYNDDAVAEVNYFTTPNREKNQTDSRTKDQIYSSMNPLEEILDTNAKQEVIFDNSFKSKQEETQNMTVANQEAGQDNGQTNRPPLTEKYYDRLYSADLETTKKSLHKQSYFAKKDATPESQNQNIQANCASASPKKVQSLGDEPSYNEIYSNKKFKEYYDSLKEKYGYNKNVLADYQNEQVYGNKVQSNQTTPKKDASRQKTTALEEETVLQDNISESEAIRKSNEKRIATSQAPRHDIPSTEYDEKLQTETALQKEAALQKEKDSQKKQTVQKETAAPAIEKSIPIMEAASTLNVNSVPPLDSAFTRIRLGTFYEQIKDQIEEIFKKHPHNSELESIIPDSKWVRVDYNGDGKYYVVGVIGKPDYICYGVPATYTDEPPKELDGYCQWLPLDVSNPTKNGYWLLFQDAVSGESIKNEII